MAGTTVYFPGTTSYASRVLISGFGEGIISHRLPARKTFVLTHPLSADSTANLCTATLPDIGPVPLLHRRRYLHDRSADKAT